MFVIQNDITIDDQVSTRFFVKFGKANKVEWATNRLEAKKYKDYSRAQKDMNVLNRVFKGKFFLVNFS